VVVLLGAAAFGTAQADPAQEPSTAIAPQPVFDKPVTLTIDKNFGGYEPGLVVDRFNNIVVTAHKQNHGVALSPDTRASSRVRSESWVWASADGGKTFTDMPGLTPIAEQNLDFGDEGDLALDATDHLYFVDTNVVDVTFSRWKATGPGKFALETHRPLLPAAEAVDDRPWIVAQGDGVVLYLGNQGDKATYPAGSPPAGGTGSGAGRYTVYRSTNHGDTFDSLGFTLPGSGWCRPAADPRVNATLVYVVCTNDNNASAVEQITGVTGGTGPALLSAYVSSDGGKTFTRSTMGPYNGKDSYTSWPSVRVGNDGTVYALYEDHDIKTVGTTNTPTYGHLRLFTSIDQGKTWGSRDAAVPGMFSRYAWMAVSKTGEVSVAWYGRMSDKDDWHVYVRSARSATAPFGPAVLADGGKTIATKGNTYAFGDFFEIAYGPDGLLNVVYTSQNTDLVAEGLNTDIYFARQLPAGAATAGGSAPSGVDTAVQGARGVRLPATGGSSRWLLWGSLAVLAGGAVFRVRRGNRYRRHRAARL
jgi:LPXTG-motif cell wall-anchored protein